jgi:hypothetical protein
MTLSPGRLRKDTPLATNLALLVFGLIAIEFCRTGVHEFHHFVHGYSESVFAQILVYLGAVSLVERCPTNKWTLRIILAVALFARLFCVFAPPFLSTDIYRSVWDGNVQAAGINPFRYVPADSHLLSSRRAVSFSVHNSNPRNRHVHEAEHGWLRGSHLLAADENIQAAESISRASGHLCVASSVLLGDRQQRPCRRGRSYFPHAGHLCST